MPEPVAPLQVAAPPPQLAEKRTAPVNQQPERKAVRTPRAPRTTSSPRPPAAPVPVSDEFHGPAPVKKRKSRQVVRDEWGFFDPQQCGFAALLKKLDELAESDERGAR